jgi:hypothetical protein
MLKAYKLSLEVGSATEQLLAALECFTPLADLRFLSCAKI